MAAKHAMKAAWPLKTDDFFPYADCPHCYWTGDCDRCRDVSSAVPNWKLSYDGLIA